MKPAVLVGFGLTAAIALASCSQDQSTTASAPTEARFARNTTPTCSFSTASNHAKDYFSSNRDPVYGLLSTMSKAATPAAMTDAGWNVLARVETAIAHDSVKAGAASAGSIFVNDVFLCMTGITGYSYSVDFTKALGPDGLFAVRDANTNTSAESHSSDYGAEPPSGNWPLSSRALLYAEKLTVSSLANEPQAGVLFDLKTLPTNALTGNIRVGVCTITDPTARVLHAHQGDSPVILPPDAPLSFCPTSSTLNAGFGGFAFLSKAASWLAPKPAYAAMFATRSGGGTGLVSGLSEIGPVSFTSVVSFTVPPQNTTRSASPQQFTPTVTVLDTTSHGNPVKGVLITLTVVGNNGSYNISGDTATTNQSGIATFPNLHIDKAGGYTVTATSEVGGSASATFNISGL
jgi:hypothetical protein